LVVRSLEMREANGRVAELAAVDPGAAAATPVGEAAAGGDRAPQFALAPPPGRPATRGRVGSAPSG
ncbi:MAG: hypothetical protein ACM3UV_03815, partial [Nocardioidaceae bacterium]